MMIDEQIDEQPSSEAETRLRELGDQLLRARAELENQRKRSARQIEDARKFALQKFIHELLPVKDSLEQGIEAASDDDGQEAESLRQGIQLTLRLWREALAREGVEEIDPAGQPFNPDFHEALAIRPSPDVPPNTVLEVVQKGYLLNGRLVRAARVIVTSDGQSDGAH